MADFIIKNGLVVSPTGVIEGGLAVTGDKITEVGNNESLPKKGFEVDAGGNYVLPGVIDPHTHLHQQAETPMLPFGEAIKTESVSGAISGTTTVISSPHFWTMKTPKQLSALREQKKAGNKKSCENNARRISFKIWFTDNCFACH